MDSKKLDRRIRPRGVRGRWSAAFLATALLCGLVGTSAFARDEATKRQMQGLDEQVQGIKSEVLSIAAELAQLEEKLLFPSNTQVAVFISIAEGESMKLDSVRIALDGEPVAHHIYSFKELQALEKGGVQRIYTGNVTTGDHRIEVSVAGTNATGGELGGVQQFQFTKGAEPALVDVTLAGGALGDATVEIGSF